MRLRLIAVAWIGVLTGAWEGQIEMANANLTQPTKEVRTYLSVSQPIDPAQVFTLADLDMSYALGSTLVDWDSSKQIVAGLASSWAQPTAHVLTFTLSDRARWSNGAPVTSLDVKKSLERAKRVHGQDLKSLFDVIDHITCLSDKVIEFHVRGEKAASAILKKLTEPMYGVLRLDSAGELALGVSSGPYFVSRNHKDETVLERNTHWVNYDPGIPDRVTLRPLPARRDEQTTLLSDPWPNLMATNSLMSSSVGEDLKKHHLTPWTRSLDRTLMLAPFRGKIHTADGFQFFRHLQKKLVLSQVTSHLTGFTPAEQIFPKGSSLAVEHLSCPSMPDALPGTFRGKALRVLTSSERVSLALRDNFARAIEAVVGAKPTFHEVRLADLLSAIKQADYDFYLGPFSVADPNIDGVLSYHFELGTPPVPSGSGAEDFARRTAEVRTEKDEGKRLGMARAMLNDVVCYGHVVPLIHFSTVVIARQEIDLARVPTTEECISFSKVRFR